MSTAWHLLLYNINSRGTVLIAETQAMPSSATDANLNTLHEIVAIVINIVK